MNELRIRSNEDCSSNSNSLAFIDALRGMAAIYVVICHVGFIPSPALALQGLGMRFVHAGHTGVILFSGQLINSLPIIFSKKERKQPYSKVLLTKAISHPSTILLLLATCLHKRLYSPRNHTATLYSHI